ncbi:GTPase [Thermohalobacter berrensis]|uniref:GTP-binding protein HSR1 n=1 Tax=Thermohalobacter berrensis TaxID=99594 RepID=A0A419TAL7_9FIRM|nr:GTPase [Thermohalobacter berrensis]RKD34513.1 GTP-binding protein HSR1 [Thermohalobacter berrensis]
MKKAIIIGRTNVGKTTFMINFADYIGLSKILIKSKYPDGKILNKEFSLHIARKNLISNKAYKTTCLQSISLEIPVYKGSKKVEIIDSSGLCDGIHPNMQIRKSIVQTLENIQNSSILIHIIDLSQSIKDRPEELISEIDRQIIKYGSTRTGYVLLANKIDIKETKEAVDYLKENFSNVLIIPISALYKKGFNEVKKFVINSI